MSLILLIHKKISETASTLQYFAIFCHILSSKNMQNFAEFHFNSRNFICFANMLLNCWIFDILGYGIQIRIWIRILPAS